MRSAKADQSPQRPADLLKGDERLPCAGRSYLERLGIVYSEQIRLTIVTELYMREMGVNKFFETIGGSSYDSVRRHFGKLAEYAWIRKVRTVATGRGRPEALYRSTELPVIDNETWRILPFSIRDAFTVQLLEEMGTRLGEALENGTADVRPDGVAVFKVIHLTEAGWCEANDAVERCFQTLQHEQIDAKIRLENTSEKPIQTVVNLAAFEAPSIAADQVGATASRLPKPEETLLPPPWPQPIGRIFTEPLDLRIVDQLNDATMTPAELKATLGGTDRQGFLRRCKRLTQLGLAVEVDTRSGGPLHGASVYQFRAAAPGASESDIFKGIPMAVRAGSSWEAFKRFTATSLAAVDTGTFNSRFDRHLTMSPLLLDELGWIQVARALRACEATLLQLEDRCCTRTSDTVPAAFLLSSFQAPLPDIEH